MLKISLFIIACSVITYGMSIETAYSAIIHSSFNSLSLTEQLSLLMVLLNLQTGVPANGFDFTNLTELINVIGSAHCLFELGYTHINGVVVYAIKIGNIIYSVEPRIFHSLIFMLF